MSVQKRSGGIFDYDQRSERLVEVEREMEMPTVWDDPDRAQALGKERADLDLIVSTIDNLTAGLSDAEGLLEMAVEEDDPDTATEIESDLEALDAELEKLEFRRMFSGEMDANKRLPGNSGRLGWHRSSGLGEYAVAHVSALG